MKNLIVYLGCGNVSKNRGAIYFQVTNFSDLTNKIIPIFQKYPLQGEKLLVKNVTPYFFSKSICY
jgi:hypothetical protein